uniref:Uncharacterized protein n=1 Tax=Oryza meridionalis TaxID=40149 RepID=A0A0E0FB56_9ORYZ
MASANNGRLQKCEANPPPTLLSPRGGSGGDDLAAPSSPPSSSASPPAERHQQSRVAARTVAAGLLANFALGWPREPQGSGGGGEPDPRRLVGSGGVAADSGNGGGDRDSDGAGASRALRQAAVADGRGDDDYGRDGDDATVAVAETIDQAAARPDLTVPCLNMAPPHWIPGGGNVPKLGEAGGRWLQQEEDAGNRGDQWGVAGAKAGATWQGAGGSQS